MNTHRVCIKSDRMGNSFVHVLNMVNKAFPGDHNVTIKAAGNGMQLVGNLDDQQLETLKQRLARYTTLHIVDIDL